MLRSLVGSEMCIRDRPKGDPGEDGKDGDPGDPFSGNFADDVTFGGSATFAGTVVSGDFSDTYIALFPEGQCWLSTDLGATSPSLAVGIKGGNQTFGVYKDGKTYIGTNIQLGSDGRPLSSNIEFNPDGSAEFAGNKAGFTAEGYLWCTTRRGDTVILDSTSNGVGIWEDYTPTTRKDEIRDKLDALRDETPDTGADTP